MLKCNSGKQWAFLRSIKVLPENERVISGNKRAILGIKGHFWEVEAHIELRTRVRAT